MAGLAPLAFEEGHQGRELLFQVFPVDDEVKEAVFEKEFTSLKALRFTAECGASRGSEKAKTFAFIAMLLLKNRV